jgi:hypothetical protein
MGLVSKGNGEKGEMKRRKDRSQTAENEAKNKKKGR